jgi:hypothetical protein
MMEMCFGGYEDGRHWFFLCVGCLVSCSSGLGKRGCQHLWNAFLMVLLEYRVVISRVKDQGMAFTGFTLLKSLFCEVGLSPG